MRKSFDPVLLRLAERFLVDRNGLVGRGQRLQLGDLAFKISDRLFEIEVGLHAHAPVGPVRAMRPQSGRNVAAPPRGVKALPAPPTAQSPSASG